MKIYYQGNSGSYMHTASVEIKKYLNINISKEDIIGKPNFQEVWESIGEEGIGVLAIENSYMGSIHQNLYGFLKHDFKIIGDYFLEINHCLCSKETDIKKIKKAYSQMPALEQCYNYLKKKNIKACDYSDTALSAKLASETEKQGVAGICSELAAKMYDLNILEKNIQDQSGNTTRFVIIVPKNSGLIYTKKSNKISILFEAKNISSSLYHCLSSFAINNINLSKIESLPSYKGSFSYYFWIDFDGSLEDSSVKKALKDLEEYTSMIKIIGEY